MSSKSIKNLMKFPSERTASRRLKFLADNNYLKREKLIYGVPYLYTLTHKGRMIIGANKRAENIRLDTIRHNLMVLECVDYVINSYHVTIDDITTEKELHRKDGFGIRYHRPDFIFQLNNEVLAVELELTLKPLNLLSQNIKQNFLTYDRQIWFIDKANKKLYENIQKHSSIYDNIMIRFTEVFLS
jgi:hypothetical protein